MAFPAGTSLAVLTSGNASNFVGEGLSIEATVTPVLKGTKYIWHADTGGFLVPETQTFKGEAGVGINVAVPHVDQAGWRDSGGNAYTGWAYEVEIKVGAGRGKKVFHSWKKVVKPIIGQAIVDIDTIPDQGVGEPVLGEVPEVVSVNGQTGAVVIDVGQSLADPDIAALIQNTETLTGQALVDRYAAIGTTVTTVDGVSGNVGIIETEPGVYTFGETA